MRPCRHHSGFVTSSKGSSPFLSPLLRCSVVNPLSPPPPSPGRPDRDRSDFPWPRRCTRASIFARGACLTPAALEDLPPYNRSPMTHRNRLELEAGLDHVRQAPKDRGQLAMIDRRPQIGVREV